MEPIRRSQPPIRRAVDARDRPRAAFEKIEAAEHGLDVEAKETAKLLWRIAALLGGKRKRRR